MSVSKKDIARVINSKLGLSYKDSLMLTSSFFIFLIENHKRKINVNNFGSFIYKKTPKRFGRNPKTLEAFEINERIKVNFHASEKVKKIIN